MLMNHYGFMKQISLIIGGNIDVQKKDEDHGR